jgi:hypothetical protein
MSTAKVAALEAARAAGMKRYFTGRPCKNGHISERQVVNGTCVACAAAAASRYLQTPVGRLRIMTRVKKWKTENIDKVRASGRAYMTRRRSSPEIRAKRMSPEHRAAHSAYTREHGKRPDQAEKRRRRDSRRRATDINFRLAGAIRARFRLALKNRKARPGSVIKLLGCSIDHARTYLESLFLPGMSWDNHGEWHIDHKKPLSSFDLTDFAQMAEACHFTNLQPLWAIDNIRKGGRRAITSFDRCIV